MKVKNFTPLPFAFLLLFVSLFALKAEAMPEASYQLAAAYFENVIYYQNPDLENGYRIALDEMYEQDPEIYSEATQNMAQEISNLRNRKPFTQEQAVNEISRMIENGVFPADYIFDDGEYKYISGINAVITTTNVNLRSQPTTESKILRVIAGPMEKDSGPVGDICNYMGEWESPQGERWVAVSYIDDQEGKLTGWLSGKYTQFIRDAQVLQVAKIYEKAKDAPRKKVERKAMISPKRNIENTTSQPSEGYVEEVTAETLLTAFEANKIRAERAYKGKTLKITGRVLNVGYQNGTPYIALDTPRTATWIKCFASIDEPLLTEINKGMYITVQGVVSEVEGVFNTYTVINSKIISLNPVTREKSNNPLEELFQEMLRYN